MVNLVAIATYTYRVTAAHFHQSEKIPDVVNAKINKSIRIIIIIIIIIIMLLLCRPLKEYNAQITNNHKINYLAI